MNLPIDEMFLDDAFCDRLLAVDRARSAATVSTPSANTASEPDTP